MSVVEKEVSSDVESPREGGVVENQDTHHCTRVLTRNTLSFPTTRVAYTISIPLHETGSTPNKRIVSPRITLFLPGGSGSRVLESYPPPLPFFYVSTLCLGPG